MSDHPKTPVSADAPITFEELGLGPDSLKTLEKIGFETPSKIQAAFIPIALTGRDCSGQARTGTGKTAAFALPMLERLDLSKKGVHGIVLSPTRELSEQIANEFERLSDDRCKAACIVGGRSMDRQVKALKAGAQVVIGTPGRVIDLIGRGQLDLSKVEVAVLDEADRMLDIGFRPDIEKILRKCPSDRQTLLLSATMPNEVEGLAAKFMKNPERIDMSEDALVSTEMIEQFIITVDHDRKFDTLTRVLLQERPKQVIVFTRTKRGADTLGAKFMRKLKGVELIHGDLAQSKRDRVLREFRAGSVRMLIATDVVGRGIDISGVSHIINYDIPEFCDDYVHRIGRTGRLSSASKGRAITFVCRDQGDQLTNIEMRVNKLLEQYEVRGFEPVRAQKKAGHVDDKQSTEYSGVKSSKSSVYSHA
ncbi:DEAD/DEAH box helicase [Stratiformator vulcanicus]|uniref:DEAD-box ATP-dependent RNA helicase CshA n=1 Tax=Stratiformator vulcanicus TaxID=2527980 RepID=A0A517R2A2_9PLAN|nr:DEAD/DEAH box helicase [Stratiformator vulcanicus]QDT38002.1 DEAD-box ATP-dependent RNA helicase CshA [Stratiformator vulcanicus]